MKRFRVGTLCSILLLSWGQSPLGAKDMDYRLLFEESIHSAWRTDVAPKVSISSSSRLILHDKVEQKKIQLTRSGAPLGIDDNNMADFCIDAPKEPVCREIIISDFSYRGLEGVLLGNRGERLQYIVLASCEGDERTCRYPHLKLGPNPIFLLLKRGIRVHVLEEKGSDFVVAGPYSRVQAERNLKTVREFLPDAFLH